MYREVARPCRLPRMRVEFEAAVATAFRASLFHLLDRRCVQMGALRLSGAKGPSPPQKKTCDKVFESPARLVTVDQALWDITLQECQSAWAVLEPGHRQPPMSCLLGTFCSQARGQAR